MRTLVLVDFDHTLYQKDSLLVFTQFYHGKRKFYLGLLHLTPILIRWKIGLISNEKAKTHYFQYFFKNENYNDFIGKARIFATTLVPADLNPIVLEKVKNHLQQSHSVCIVTASFPEWIKPWAESLNIEVIGTTLEQIDAIITGKFSSKNCYGIEKVNRIKKEINLDSFAAIYVYGKGKGDREMLQLRK